MLPRVAIFVFVVAAAAVAGLGWRAVIGWPLGALLVAVISFLDDLRHMPRAARFAVHMIAAAIALFAYGASMDVVGLIVAFFWIVAFTNIFNFMDGSNGIAGTQALVAGLGWAIAATLFAQPAIVILGAAIAGASLGFLKHNWTPATIFMGDVGATFLGYTFAVLPVMVLPASRLEAAAGVLFVWPFAADGGLTILRRALNRENILQPHRSHIYQRLIRNGRSHAAVAVLYGFLALLGVAAGLVLSRR
jgi:UDP-N-acetylmuramyl pentapeptide phosphotransferase/UDP-N-acetylglucosamine-1-phosphate transferase